MQSLRQIGAGMLLSAFSVVIVLGGMMLALAEGGMVPTPIVRTLPTGEIITVYPTLPLSFTSTPRGLDVSPTASFTPPPTLINCPPPVGWLPIVTQPDDTLDSLAQAYNSTASALQKGNCLLNNQLMANSVLYVPARPTSTLKPCGAPVGWVSYTVNAGDTLYGISLLYRINWQELLQANCLDSSYIKTGQILKVPNVPISTVPASTYTPIPTEIATPVSTPTIINIPTPTDTPPTITETLTAPATTEVPSPTVSPIPSDTLVPTETTIP